MTHQTIILQVQGGMGNQMIQYAFLEAHLSKAEGCKVIVNPIMTSKAWARVRGISHRPLSKLLTSHFPIIKSKRKQIYDWLQSKQIPQGHAVLSDRILEIPDKAHVIHCNGYFQTQQAFGNGSNPVWRSILNSMQNDEPKVNGLYSTGKVAVHYRLGDYLWKENQRLFAQISLKERVEKALDWRESLGSHEPIAIFTDSPDVLQVQKNEELTPAESNECMISANTSALEDFIELSRHRHIVAGCSTFSLCAGRIAWERLQKIENNQNQQTLLLPASWYKDEIMNERMMTEMDSCIFTKTSRDHDKN